MKFDLDDILRPKNYVSQPICFAQSKADGIRIVVFKRDNGKIEAWTRNGLTDFWPKISRLPKIANAIESLPAQSILDCELHCPGVQATDVKTLVNDADERLLLTPFAVPMLDGESMLSAKWGDVEMAIWEMGLTPPQTIHLSRTPTELTDDWRATLQEIAAEQKYEGWVLKEAHYKGWYKLKGVKTVDCLVTGFKRSDSLSFFGGLKAIIVAVKKGTELVEIASVGSGFDADFRMNCDPTKLIGRVCEVSYDSLAGQGKLKFPRFVRWRDDKLPHECTYDQLEQ